MSPSPTDRRVRRTRELLRSAFLSLILEKGYDRITVQDILDKADVGRSTFYAHYRDKEDLLHAGFEDIRAALAAEGHASESDAGGAGALLEPLIVVFTHVEAHRRFWEPMSRKGGTNIIGGMLRESVDDLVREHLRSRFPESAADSTQLEPAVQFVVGACMGLLVWWLDHEEVAFSAREIHAIFGRLATPGVERFLATA